LTDQSNNKIQKDHENEPLVHKPDEPNDHYNHMRMRSLFNVFCWLPKGVVWSIYVSNSILVNLQEIPGASIETFKFILFTIDSKNIEKPCEEPSPEEKEKHERNTINDALSNQVFH
jgi:hypothetical protein